MSITYNRQQQLPLNWQQQLPFCFKENEPRAFDNPVIRADVGGRERTFRLAQLRFGASGPRIVGFRIDGSRTAFSLPEDLCNLVDQEALTPGEALEAFIVRRFNGFIVPKNP